MEQLVPVAGLCTVCWEIYRILVVGVAFAIVLGNKFNKDLNFDWSICILCFNKRVQITKYIREKLTDEKILVITTPQVNLHIISQ